MTPGDWKPFPVAGIEVNEVADGLVVHRPDTGDIHYLNNTAASVFVLCGGDRSVADIVDEVGRTFSLSRPPAGEVVRCIEALMDGGLLR